MKYQVQKIPLNNLNNEFVVTKRDAFTCFGIYKVPLNLDSQRKLKYNELPWYAYSQGWTSPRSDHENFLFNDVLNKTTYDYVFDLIKFFSEEGIPKSIVRTNLFFRSKK
jgi:hypothetical protein